MWKKTVSWPRQSWPIINKRLAVDTIKASSIGGLIQEESPREHERSHNEKVRTKLGGAVLSYIHHGDRSISVRRPKQKTNN